MTTPNTPRSVGLRSLAVGFPSIRRTNDYWRVHKPDMVEKSEQYSLAKVWSAPAVGIERNIFDETMDPFRDDPFRGAVERRIRAPQETALSMELTAARGALAAAKLQPSDVDLVLVTSFVGDRFGVGNAAYVAEALGITQPTWNYETACSGSVVGLQLASSLIRSGEYDRVLVIASTSNSQQVTPDDTIAWFVGDGAGAFVVEAREGPQDVLGSCVIPSVGTNDMFVIRSVPDGSGRTRLVTQATPSTAAIARDTAEPYLRDTVTGALTQARMQVKDVDFWVFNTPTAWYADFCARVLDVPQGRYHSVYSRYGNIGAALMPATLYHALHQGRVKAGDVVGMYSIGSTSTSACVLMRIGEVALGPYPEPPVVPDHDALGPPNPAPVQDVLDRPRGPKPRQQRGLASRAEAEALARTLWTDPPPAPVRRWQERGSLKGDEDEVWSDEHHIQLGDGRRIRVTERATLASLLSAPRRGILLLSGPISNSGAFEIDVPGYDLQSMLARRGYFSFAVDYSGTPGSSQPSDGTRPTHPTTTRDMRHVLQQLRELRWLPPMDILGESTGGAIAAELADDPTKVRRCVLASMLYRAGSQFFEDVFLNPGFVDDLRAAPHGYLDVQPEFYGNIVAHAPPAVSAQFLRTQPGRYAIAPLLSPLTLPWFDPAGAQVPALIVHGEKDNIPAPGDTEDLAANYGRTGGGQARIVRLPQAGHVPRLGPPQISSAFFDAAIAFLNEL